MALSFVLQNVHQNMLMALFVAQMHFATALHLKTLFLQQQVV
jgi:hypothetical protein